MSSLGRRLRVFGKRISLQFDRWAIGRKELLRNSEEVVQDNDDAVWNEVDFTNWPIVCYF